PGSGPREAPDPLYLQGLDAGGRWTLRGDAACREHFVLHFAVRDVAVDPERAAAPPSGRRAGRLYVLAAFGPAWYRSLKEDAGETISLLGTGAHGSLRTPRSGRGPCSPNPAARQLRRPTDHRQLAGSASALLRPHTAP